MWALSRIITDNWFLSIPMFLVMWIVCIFIGMCIIGLFDRTTREASRLGMKQEDFELYEKLFSQQWELIMKYGEDSSEVNEFYIQEVFPKIKNPIEWKRCQEYFGAKKLEKLIKGVL